MDAIMRRIRDIKDRLAKAAKTAKERRPPKKRDANLDELIDGCWQAVADMCEMINEIYCRGKP
jgi:sugar-specific transcriptional regulator TrmB